MMSEQRETCFSIIVELVNGGMQENFNATTMGVKLSDSNFPKKEHPVTKLMEGKSKSQTIMTMILTLPQ